MGDGKPGLVDGHSAKASLAAGVELQRVRRDRALVGGGGVALMGAANHVILHPVTNIDVLLAMVVPRQIRCHTILLEQWDHILLQLGRGSMLTDRLHRIVPAHDDVVSGAGLQGLLDPLELALGQGQISGPRQLIPRQLVLPIIGGLAVAGQHHRVDHHELHRGTIGGSLGEGVVQVGKDPSLVHLGIRHLRRHIPVVIVVPGQDLETEPAICRQMLSSEDVLKSLVEALVGHTSHTGVVEIVAQGQANLGASGGGDLLQAFCCADLPLRRVGLVLVTAPVPHHQNGQGVAGGSRDSTEGSKGHTHESLCDEG
mmetsp:Transcript_93098/g.249248  ORF Transcript_93098/g.249248 Transcript_93098/m.249248 type:complete len:313 (-) Transcript_93098:22-960(-)